MKKIDRLILSEVLGPWIFGVAIFSVLITAGTFLFQLTNYIVQGIGLFTVIELLLLQIPGVLVLTFPMSMLLATLLAFGRLSGDSEVTALRAAGVSLGRIMVPVGMFGTAVALGAILISEFVVPPAATRADILQAEIVQRIQKVSEKATSYPLRDPESNALIGYITAKDFDIVNRTLTGATLVSYDEHGQPNFYLWAPKLVYTNENDWKIEGNSELTSADGRFFIRLEDGAWPTQMPQPRFRPEDLLASSQKRADSQTMASLRAQIEEQRRVGKATDKQIANLEYMYWNKIAVPMAAIVYALVGAPLGIRNHRTGAATGFALAVVIIFLYQLLANVLTIMSQGGNFPAYVASFAPVTMGIIFAIGAIAWKNR